jgi:peptidoglycan/LPS O-acetylase OafA/YrhL
MPYRRRRRWLRHWRTAGLVLGAGALLAALIVGPELVGHEFALPLQIMAGVLVFLVVVLLSYQV